jgi:hypothetical protein
VIEAGNLADALLGADLEADGGIGLGDVNLELPVQQEEEVFIDLTGCEKQFPVSSRRTSHCSTSGATVPRGPLRIVDGARPDRASAQLLRVPPPLWPRTDPVAPVLRPVVRDLRATDDLWLWLRLFASHQCQVVMVGNPFVDGRVGVCVADDIGDGFSHHQVYREGCLRGSRPVAEDVARPAGQPTELRGAALDDEGLARHGSNAGDPVAQRSTAALMRSSPRCHGLDPGAVNWKEYRPSVLPGGGKIVADGDDRRDSRPLKRILRQRMRKRANAFGKDKARCLEGPWP